MTNLAFGCADVDELAAAYALGAMETDDARAVAEHLAECREPHTELRELLPFGTMMLAELDSDAEALPSPATRSRLLQTIATTPQDHRAAAPSHVHVPVGTQAAPERRAGLFDWFHPRAMGAVAAAAVIAAIGLGAWSVQLRSELSAREERLEQVALTVAADGTAYRVEGSGGSGYLVERGDGTATVILGSLSDLEEGERYQMWLLTDEELVTAGSFTATDEDLILVPLQRPIADFTTFAISVETEPVEAPSDDPVMVASLDN